MKSELIVDVQAEEVSFALLEDSRLVSLQKESRNLSYAVGDIYLAKVKKLMPGLNAAFVNVGYEKDAFLHFTDLGPHFTSYEEFMRQLLEGKDKRPGAGSIPSVSRMKLMPEIDKHGSITNLLAPGRELMVQIIKEPISSKGPRLTTDIAFTGRFMVLQPFCDKVSVSQKIKSSEEKTRLRRIIESIKPRNFGVIIRTSAEGKMTAELHQELRMLLQSWEEAVAKARTATCPSMIFEEKSRVVGMLRDIFNPTFENIYVNNRETFNQIAKYVTLISPDQKDIVKFYDKREPIFDHFNITRQIKASFGKTVSFKNGAYIIIEHTEALHVIDVNSGNRTKADSDQETNALEVNLRAGEEIARQLRLRDMGGIIVVDFIDMAKSEHRQQLYDHMRELMAKDRARHNILPLSKFGLMQITRQRVRPVLDITTTETCPSCFGTGTVRPSLLFTDTLAEKIEFLINSLEQRNFIVYVHPYVEAYIKKGLFTSLYGSWRRKFGRHFKIMSDQSLAYLQYRVIDKEGNEIQLHSEKDTDSSSATKAHEKVRNRGGDDHEEEKPEKPAKGQRLIDQPRELLPKKEKKEKEASNQQPKSAEKQQQAKQKAAQQQQKPKQEKAPKQANEEKTEKKENTVNEAQPSAQKAQQPKPARQKPKAQAAVKESAPAPEKALVAEAQANQKADMPKDEAPKAASNQEPARKPRQRSARKPRAATVAPNQESEKASVPTADSSEPMPSKSVKIQED